MTYIKKTIGDICLVGDGAHKSLKRVENGIPYLTSKNFKETGLSLEKIDFISVDDFDSNFKENSKALTKPKENDILLSIIGSLGGTYLVKKEDLFGLSSSVAIIRVQQEIIPEYLYYWINTDFFQSNLLNMKRGVAQGYLSLDMIRSLPVIYPDDLIYQKKISSTLRKYDLLIENNLKRIKLLEELGERIYKKWFIDFEFPGYENCEFKDGIPVEWEKDKFKKIGSFQGGYAFKSSEWREEGYPVIKIKNIEENLKVINLDDIQYILNIKDRDEYIVKEKDILIALTGATIGKIALFQGSKMDCYLNQRVARVKCKPNYVEFIYFFFGQGTMRDLINSLSQGAAQPNISTKDLENIELFVPSDEIINLFSLKVSNILESKIKLINQLNLLQEARDRLLPKLMNGEIEL